jgi:predicted RNase H-like HicB family nuclease
MPARNSKLKGESHGRKRIFGTYAYTASNIFVDCRSNIEFTNRHSSAVFFRYYAGEGVEGVMSEKQNELKARPINSIPIGLIASFVWGTILWLFAILSEMWVSHTITLTIATIGTLLWAVGLIAICRTGVGMLRTCSYCKDYSESGPRDRFIDYIHAALERAQYSLIDNSDEPCFANVPELNGVWATGHTIEDARRELIEVLEKWIAARLATGLPIPPIGGQYIKVP